ncbi:MAG: hypothetical protein OEY85_10385 [Rhodospirillales bacterium]|nr:hypothetical protein [Rhodospirillales bacterium]
MKVALRFLAGYLGVLVLELAVLRLTESELNETDGTVYILAALSLISGYISMKLLEERGTERYMDLMKSFLASGGHLPITRFWAVYRASFWTRQYLIFLIFLFLLLYSFAVAVLAPDILRMW